MIAETRGPLVSTEGEQCVSFHSHCRLAELIIGLSIHSVNFLWHIDLGNVVECSVLQKTPHPAPLVCNFQYDARLSLRVLSPLSRKAVTNTN